MMEAHKNIPELRFPGFEGEWDNMLLGDILTFKNGINAAKEDYGFGHKFINVLDIINNDFITNEKIIGSVNISDADFQKNLVEYGDILFQRSSETREEVGQANVYLDKNKPATFGGFVIRGKKKAEYNPLFLNYLLKTQKARNEITTKSGGSTRYNIGQETLSAVGVFMSNLNEQQKIASFLSSVDQRIQLLTRKKEQLEQYKKGVMQQIFSQQLRFKDEQGKEYPEWEETQFGFVYRFLSTNSLSREKLNYEFGTIKNIHYGDIHTKFKSHFIIDNELVPYINPEIDLSKINADNFLKEGDLIIADASEDYADIGKSIEIYQLNNQAVLAGLHTILARRKHQKVLIGFGGHMMKSFEVRNQIQRIAQGTKVLSISANRLSELKILLPSKPEQQKIASFLSSIDDKITRVNTKIEQTRKWKQGLLQKMFV